MAKEKWHVHKKTKDATIFETSSGKKVARLTPSGKMKRYDRELKSGKNSRTGEKLTDVQAGYRIGYRAALGEQASIYNKKKK